MISYYEILLKFPRYAVVIITHAVLLLCMSILYMCKCACIQTMLKFSNSYHFLFYSVLTFPFIEIDFDFNPNRLRSSMVSSYDQLYDALISAEPVKRSRAGSVEVVID